VEVLAGRVAVVTGGASGIGRALARRLLDEQVRVVVADVEQAALDETVGELDEVGEVHGVRCDVSDAADVERLAAFTLDRLGAVHLVCNNAGVAGAGGPVSRIPLEQWEWVLGVNLWGVIHGVRVFLPHLIEQGEGHIVNTASIMGLIPSPMTAPYSVSKYGVVALSEALHLELARYPAINVSVLCPSWVATNISDAERNRPGHLQGDGADARTPELAERVRAALSERGASAGSVADLAVDAIRGNRFYVLNHDGNDRLVRHRAAAILDGLPPFFDVLH
jgi:NAD(P)-dependent dehydrogenase (short-subunit alcohol dehydrogenase family)